MLIGIGSIPFAIHMIYKADTISAWHTTMFATLLLLILGSTNILATDYILLVEDPDIYTPCLEGPPGSVSLNEAFDVSEMEVEMDEEGIHVSGNITARWSLPRSNRISAKMSVLHFNRGSWEPTVFNSLTPDFCAVMFNPNLFWHKYWFKNFENREEIQEKCLATEGTVLVYNPFVVIPRLNNVIGPTLKGRYKVVFLFEAFNEHDERQPSSVCFEITGDAEKIN
ncbi:uncharacterized protein LOC6530309 isoform X1 [Drosophila yakuba]|uniref:Uncharacterized protein, isoform B n=2 Tax=Drosophila yakuba TaxID=7245 RepID=A0A0R1DXH8_DROYA|nr:uncharacterized protein LOC6530309 isoform X1 [Drosophila yakuba]KRJ99526.1 uncharacterized protein Dyak_GE13540, isoform B [Drosophila yakuba]